MVAQLPEGEVGYRRAGGAGVFLQVVEAEPLEVACADNGRFQTEGKVVRVAQSLLDRRDLAFLARFLLVEIDASALLLDQEPGVGAQHVDKPAAGGLVLEFRIVDGVRHAEHVLHQVEPELLGLLLLMPLPVPTVDELPDLLLRRHGSIMHPKRPDGGVLSDIRRGG